MKAGEVNVGQSSSRESWLSAPLSDPNATLWASISPPADPDLATRVRRRAAAFSLDLLAQRLFLRFPGWFSSRATARTAILSAAAAAGAALGAAAYLGLQEPVAQPAPASAASADAASVEAPPNAPPRQGHTELAEVKRGASAPAATALAATTLAATTLAATAPAKSASSAAEPLADPTAPKRAALSSERRVAPVKARSGTKKRMTGGARRIGKRRARAQR